MPDEFNYIKDDPKDDSKFPGMEHIKIIREKPGKFCAKSESETLFTFRTYLFGTELEVDQVYRIVQLYPFLLKGEDGKARYEVIPTTLTKGDLKFSDQGVQYLICSHKRGSQLLAVNNEDPLAILVEAWRDSELDQGINYHLFTRPKTIPLHLGFLFLSTMRDGIRHTPEPHLPILRPK